MMQTAEPTPEARVDRTAMSASRLADIDTERRDYWAARPPIERWRALEMLRVQMHGYDPAAARLSRFFEVLKRTAG